MYITESKTLNVTVTGSQKTPIWKSDNIAIATVNSKGTISAKKAGTAIITVTVDGVKKSFSRTYGLGAMFLIFKYIKIEKILNSGGLMVIIFIHIEMAY